MPVKNIIDSNLLAQIKKMSVTDRLLIVEDIWDSIALSNKKLPVSDEHKSDLDNRFLDYKKDPSTTSTWKDVKNRIESKL